MSLLFPSKKNAVVFILPVSILIGILALSWNIYSNRVTNEIHQNTVHCSLIKFPTRVEAVPIEYFRNVKASFLKGDYRQVANYYSRSIEFYPRKSFVYDLRAKYLMLAGDGHAALEDSENIIRLAPSSANSYFVKGMALATAEQYSEALSNFDKAIEISPDRGDYFQAHGLAASAIGKHKQAVKDYSKALKLEPQCLQIYVLRGLSYRALNNKQQSRSDFDIVAGLATNSFAPNTLDAFKSSTNLFKLASNHLHLHSKGSHQI